MGGKSSAPPAPDYAGAAQQTAQGNLENSRLTTKANRVNYNTPYGSLSYSQDPNDQDLWSANVALDPQQQNLLNSQNAASQGLSDLTAGGVQRVGSAVNSAIPSTYDPTAATNQAQELIMSRLAPQQARDQAALNTQLTNQGITQGSEAWRNAQTQLGQTQNDARSQAALQGINLGQSQQAQQYAQQTANRNIPINELNALRTGAQVTNPTFGNSPQQNYTGGADVMGATNAGYNAALNSTNAQNASSGNFMSGLFGLGAAGIPLLSDRRAKMDIRRVGTLDTGLPVYAYRYQAGGPVHIGVMAQEALIASPDAVHQHESGYLMVDYGAL